jgi:hypothetical protein
MLLASVGPHSTGLILDGGPPTLDMRGRRFVGPWHVAPRAVVLPSSPSRESGSSLCSAEAQNAGCEGAGSCGDPNLSLPPIHAASSLGGRSTMARRSAKSGGRPRAVPNACRECGLIPKNPTACTAVNACRSSWISERRNSSAREGYVFLVPSRSHRFVFVDQAAEDIDAANAWRVR